MNGAILAVGDLTEAEATLLHARENMASDALAHGDHVLTVASGHGAAHRLGLGLGLGVGLGLTPTLTLTLTLTPTPTCQVPETERTWSLRGEPVPLPAEAPGGDIGEI